MRRGEVWRFEHSELVRKWSSTAGKETEAHRTGVNAVKPQRSLEMVAGRNGAMGHHDHVGTTIIREAGSSFQSVDYNVQDPRVESLRCSPLPALRILIF